MLQRERLAASGALLLLCIAAAAPLARAAIDWRPCPDDWYTGDYADTREYIDCAQLPVPLSYRDPEGEQLEVWLTRVHPAGGAPPEAEVWALQGGPGDPATAIVPLFLSLVRDGRLNVTGVMPELRGVGGASRLLCSNGAPADLAVCPEEVAANRSYLSHFVLDNAARDVAAALREAGEPEAGIPRILYALSAGTLWANKIFVLEPNVTSLLDAVVLDSVVHPAAASVVSYDHNADQVDQQWLEQCALDPDCGPHWPGGLVRTWQAVLQSIQNNSNACVAVNWPWLGGRQGADRLRVALKMVSASWWGRPLAPAVVWRLDRCSPQDVAELDAWMATNGLDSSEATAAPVNVTIAGLIGPWGHNMLVQDIVTFNDWTARSATQGLNVSSPADLRLIQAAADAWQAASLQGINYVTGLLRDKFPLLWKSEEAGSAGQVAEIQGIPVVILSGTGDTNTPNRFAQQLVSEHPQYLLLPFENAGHVVMMLEADPDLRGCMEELLSQVLARIQAGEEVSTQTVDAQMCAPGSGGMPRIDWAARSSRTRAVLESIFGPGAEVYPAATVDGA